MLHIAYYNHPKSMQPHTFCAKNFLILSLPLIQGSETELPAGTHSYPFTCALPPTLPSSFEGEFGHVRYTIKVTLDRPWKFDQDMKMAFTVISPVDLNVNPRVKVCVVVKKII